jgi:MYXO-CTERM domain-containing protein
MRSPAAIALLFMSAVTLANRPARACSRVVTPVLRALPADGARDVPTNTHIVVDLAAAQIVAVAVDDWVELRDPAGNLVPTTRADGYVWDGERVPVAPLAPATTYTLHARSGTTDLSSSFTTGSGPSTAVPAKAVAAMEHYALPGSGDSCAPQQSGTCVAVPEDAVVELTFVDTFGTEVGSGWSADGERPKPYLQRGPFFVNLSGRDQGTNFVCARLRTRALDGTVSEPVELCGADARTFAVTSPALTCTPQGLKVDGALAATSARVVPTASLDDGCAVAGGPARSSPWLALGLAAALLLVVRRRAR